MKKLFLGTAIAVSSLTFAQQFGVKAGVNISNLSKDPVFDNQKSKVGFNAGFFMNAPIAENFSIQPELLYSQYGDKSEGTILGDKVSYTNQFDYITLPVMFQYNVMPNFYLEAGPELGLMVNASQKFKNHSTGNSESTPNWKEYVNNFNFGIGLGAGYYFTDNIGVTARYVAGLTDVSNDEKWGNEAKLKNNVIQLGLAYKF